MRFNPILYSFLWLLFFNCNTESKTVETEISDEEKASKSISQKEIENLKYDDFGLSRDSRNALVDWKKYQDLSTHMEYLKSADFMFFKSEPTLLDVFINDLEKEIPDAIKTNEILARISALETKILKLNSLLTLGNIPKKEQLEGIKETLVAMSNLNLQINKKFEFDANNISRPN